MSPTTNTPTASAARNTPTRTDSRGRNSRLAALAEAHLRGEAVDDDALRAEIAPCFVERARADGTTARTDVVTLSCTHYPLLTGVISYVMGDEVTLVSSADETAKEVYRVLVHLGIERPDSLPVPVHRFMTTGQPQEFREVGRRFLGPELDLVDQFAWVGA